MILTEANRLIKLIICIATVLIGIFATMILDRVTKTPIERISVRTVAFNTSSFELANVSIRAIAVDLRRRAFNATATNAPKTVSEVPAYDIAAAQISRQQLLSRVCARRKLTKGFNFEPTVFMLAETRLRYLYCMVPKVACSTWKLVLSRANGMPKSLEKRIGDPHDPRLRKFVPRFSLYSQEQRRDIRRMHFKFMFVRHPLERLVSAHRNKFVELSRRKGGDRWTDYFHSIADTIKRRYRSGRSSMRSAVTFREFVTYLLDRRTPRPFDPHWHPMHKLCDPCLVRYDFIGHYETLADDATFVLGKLSGARPKDVHFPTASEHARRNSSDRVGRALGQPTKRQLTGLRRLYWLDFELFGYK